MTVLSYFILIVLLLLQQSAVPNVTVYVGKERPNQKVRQTKITEINNKITHLSS